MATREEWARRVQRWSDSGPKAPDLGPGVRDPRRWSCRSAVLSVAASAREDERFIGHEDRYRGPGACWSGPCGARLLRG